MIIAKINMAKVKLIGTCAVLAGALLAAPAAQTVAHADPLSGYTVGYAHEAAHAHTMATANDASNPDTNDVDLNSVIGTGVTASKAEILTVSAGLVALLLTVSLIKWASGSLGGLSRGKSRI